MLTTCKLPCLHAHSLGKIPILSFLAALVMCFLVALTLQAMHNCCILQPGTVLKSQKQLRLWHLMVVRDNVQHLMRTTVTAQ